MKKRSFIVLTLLLVAAFMATLGTGAIDVFKANRSAAMKVVNDEKALISIKGDGLYALEDNNGALKLDFTSTNDKFAGEGFNPQSYSEFNNVFTITNKSAKSVYVWLEANGWSSQHNGGLRYRIEDTNGTITYVDDWYGKTQEDGKDLLYSTGYNFKTDNSGKTVGKMAYVYLDAGESVSVKIVANTVLANGYGSKGSDWSHTVIVKANTTAPTQDGGYNE